MFHYALYISPCSYAAQAGTRRGALAVVLNGVTGGPASTASFDRFSPLPFTLLSNGTGGDAAVSASLCDAGARVNATLLCGLDSTPPLGPCDGGGDGRLLADARRARLCVRAAERHWLVRQRRRERFLAGDSNGPTRTSPDALSLPILGHRYFA